MIRTRKWQRKHISEDLILAVLSLYRLTDLWTRKETPAMIVARAYPGCPLKVVYRKFEQMVDKGLIEYGVSLRFPWLTKQGEEQLRTTLVTAFGKLVLEGHDATTKEEAATV